MAVLKCKMCGADLTLKPGTSIAECEYCGSIQTVPDIADDKKARLYNRANQYRLESEFDKAYVTYESIVADAPEEAEAYWGMLLSEYGVEYVDDPKTGKKIPTCHRTLTKSVTSNANYKSACQYADSESRMMYEDEAEILNNLQKRVLNASAKEEPYDVFICYKETDEQGNRTPDSVMAQDIYDALTTKGLRVFFSRISLEDKLGQDYEPCIFAALNSAKVMLMVTTNSDYCDAVWVKNEWKRYLDFMKTDSTKTLIPVYKDISPYTLPDDFARFQAQDMSKLGAIQDLVRGVEKLTGKNQKATRGGMTQDEQKAFNKMNSSQQNTRFFLLAFVVMVVGFFAFGLTLVSLEDTNPALGGLTVYATSQKTVDIDQYMWDFEFGLPLLFSLPFACMTSWISHGFASKFSRWCFTSLYFIMCAGLTYLQVTGIEIGIVLWAVLAVFGTFGMLGTLLAYRKEKKKMVIHLLTMIAALAVVFVSSALK